MPAKIIYRFGGYAYGYKNVCLWAEEGEVADKVSVGTLNGTLYIQLDTVPDGYHKYLMGFREKLSYDEYALLLTEKHPGGRKHKEMFRILSREELLRDFVIPDGEMGIAKDNEHHIVITKDVLEYFIEMYNNYRENMELFGERSIEKPFKVAVKKIEQLNKEIKELRDKNRGYREKLDESERKMHELERKLRNCENKKYEQLIEYMKEHPNARAQSLLKRFS